MGFRHPGYLKVPCPYCGKEIGYNNLQGKHYPKCEKAQQAFKDQYQERIRNKPVECLTMGEAEDVGRFEEFKTYIQAIHNKRRAEKS